MYVVGGGVAMNTSDSRPDCWTTCEQCHWGHPRFLQVPGVGTGIPESTEHQLEPPCAAGNIVSAQMSQTPCYSMGKPAVRDRGVVLS